MEFLVAGYEIVEQEPGLEGMYKAAEYPGRVCYGSQDKVAPGTANDDTLLYGVEVKFYNMEVEVNEKLESRYKGLYIIGDGSGITHSLSHASASGIHVARDISK